MKETGLYSFGMPNRWNISLNYYYMLCLSLPVYVVAFPQLYSHMFRQVFSSANIFISFFIVFLSARKCWARSSKLNNITNFNPQTHHTTWVSHCDAILQWKKLSLIKYKLLLLLQHTNIFTHNSIKTPLLF